MISFRKDRVREESGDMQSPKDKLRYNNSFHPNIHLEHNSSLQTKGITYILEFSAAVTSPTRKKEKEKRDQRDSETMMACDLKCSILHIKEHIKIQQLPHTLD